MTAPSRSAPDRTIAGDHDALWRAFAVRDARYDGMFVAAVLTTGIYCRPSCAARKPKRENVRFYDHGDAARADGFRPCKRCAPDRARINDPERRLIASALSTLSDDRDGFPTVDEIARNAGVSTDRLRRAFKTQLDITPKQYLQAVKRARLKQGLRSGANVTQALYAAGYGAPSRIYETAHKALGMTPGALAKGGAGARLAYRIAHTSLGALLVAGAEKGLAIVRLGDDEDAMIEELGRDYPNAEFIASNTDKPDCGIDAWASALTEYVDGAPWPADLPLDIQGTAFQAKVWEALRKIPEGATASYGEIAAAIGAPKAARAVGTACAQNRIALAIPCHRVTPAAGGVGDYRWGPDRKKTLLAREAKKARS